jgi:hypothetical protein
VKAEALSEGEKAAADKVNVVDHPFFRMQRELNNRQLFYMGATKKAGARKTRALLRQTTNNKENGATRLIERKGIGIQARRRRLEVDILLVTMSL